MFVAVRALLVACLALGSGCSVPPRLPSTDPEVIRLVPRGVDRDLVASETIVIELLRLNDAEIPAAPLARAIARIESHVRGRVIVVDRGRVPASYDDDGEVVALRWPAGPRDPVAGYLVERDGGVVGFMHSEPDATSERTVDDLLLPLLDANALSITVADREPTTPKAAGLVTPTLVRASPAAPAASRGVRFARRSVELFEPRVRSRTNWSFIPHDEFWEWLIVHELGHALGVPAAAERIYQVGGDHCIRPDCVMYSPADWRMVLQILLHGWSLDFCEACAAELVESRDLEPWTDARTWTAPSATTIAPLPRDLPAACACDGG